MSWLLAFTLLLPTDSDGGCLRLDSFPAAGSQVAVSYSASVPVQFALVEAADVNEAVKAFYNGPDDPAILCGDCEAEGSMTGGPTHGLPLWAFIRRLRATGDSKVTLSGEVGAE
jgi:hypothetical protein